MTLKPKLSPPQSQKPKLSLVVQYVSAAQSLPSRAQFRRWAQAGLQEALSLTLRIVDADEGRTLNRDYRGKDYATNVLTFVYDETPDAARYGDVVICAPVVEKEATEQHKDLAAHYAHLTLHAMLHLQGYDHENDEDAARMEALETQLMLKLRFPDPYIV